jgi:hypothetical protein
MPTRIRSVSPQSQEVYLNDALPIVYVDACAISRGRGGINFLSFATSTPNTAKSIVEQVRLIIDDTSLRIVVDDLCKTIDYYPEKPRKTRKRSSK